MSKPDVRTIAVGTDTVELRRMPIDKRGDPPYQYRAMKSKWSVLLNGEERAFLILPNGWETDWELHRIPADGDFYFTGYRRTGVETIRSPSKRERWRLERAGAAIPDPVDSLARLVPGLVKKNQLRTIAEQEAEELRLKRQSERQEREAKERRERWAREQAAEAAAAEARRKETLEGLQSIRDRLDLTNFERECLFRAIARYLPEEA